MRTVLKPTATNAIAIVISAVCHPKMFTPGFSSIARLWICKAAAYDTDARPTCHPKTVSQPTV
jgi:hypothetical protein